jgi:hypothetical protein
MISAVDKININVRDQDAARRCWIETMGFSLVTDEPIGEEPGGARWIEGRPGRVPPKRPARSAGRCRAGSTAAIPGGWPTPRSAGAR